MEIYPCISQLVLIGTGQGMGTGVQGELTQETNYSSVPSDVFRTPLKMCWRKKNANQKHSPRICFTAVELSTVWMISSRSNNKRNSWSNYQPDKNAPNFKKGFRQEAPATNPDSWVSGIVDTSSFPDCRTTAISVRTQTHTWFKQEVSKFCLHYRHDPGGHCYCWGFSGKRWKEKNHKKKKKKDTPKACTSFTLHE